MKKDKEQIVKDRIDEMNLTVEQMNSITVHLLHRMVNSKEVKCREMFYYSRFELEGKITGSDSMSGKMDGLIMLLLCQISDLAKKSGESIGKIMATIFKFFADKECLEELDATRKLGTEKHVTINENPDESLIKKINKISFK